MILKILLLLILGLTTFQAQIQTITPIFPYRAGSVIISNQNGTYTQTYNVAFDGSLEIFQPAVGLSSLNYESNTVPNLYIFDIDITQYDSKNRNSFNLRVNLSNDFIINIKIRYFVATLSQSTLVILSLQNNKNTKLSDGTSQNGKSISTYSQNIISQYATAICSDFDFFQQIACNFQKAWISFVNFFTGASDMTKALYDNNQSTYSYTVLRVIFFIKLFKANTIQTDGWQFQIQSNSNNFTNLKLNVSYSNSLSNVLYNCSVILVNTSSRINDKYKIVWGQHIIENKIQYFNKPLLLTQSSKYYLIAITTININNNSRISFSLLPTEQYYYQWISQGSYNKYKFSLIGFFHYQCQNPIYPYLMMNTQQCLDVCPIQYYHNLTQCLQCETVYPCIDCDITAIYCISCDPASKTIPVDGSCVNCKSNQYFNETQLNCALCPIKCLNCTSDDWCQLCNSQYKLVLINGKCQQCQRGTYYYSEKCVYCHVQCLSCNSDIQCTQCIINYSLIQGKCLNCSDQSNILYCPIQGIICRKHNTFKTIVKKCEYLYQLTVQIEYNLNSITLYLSFNTTKQQIDAITEDYQIHLFIDQQKKQYQILNLEQHDQKICLKYNYEISYTNSFLQLVLINNTQTDRIINPKYQTNLTVAAIKQSQKQMIEVVGDIIQYISANSGVGIATMAAASGLSFFIGLIQFTQITSLYIFLNAPIPLNLKKLLQTILSARGCALLPFQIPQLMKNNQLVVSGHQIYEEYEIDLYFLRGNIGALIQTIIYISIYLFLYFAFRWIKCKNKVFKILYSKIVKRIYSNCVVSLQAILIVIAFSASATINSLDLRTYEHIINYLTGLSFITIVLGGVFINIVILTSYKKENLIDTDDAYPGIQRSRRGAQVYTFLRMLTLVVIAIIIPAFHYIYIVCFATILLIFQLHYLFNKNLFKYRIQKYLRVIHTLCFMLFNHTFLCFHVLQLYPNLNVEISSTIGLVAIISLLSIYILDFIQALIDIGDMIYQKIHYLIKRCKKMNQKSNFRDSKQLKSQQSKYQKQITNQNIRQSFNNKQ